MADRFNCGIVNIEEATKSIVSNGGGISERPNRDGTTHYSVYSTSSNRHLSYDVGNDGSYSNVHTDRDNKAYMDYNGGK